MKLSDIMGHANLALYAEVALVLFLTVFLAVAFRTFAPSRRAAMERAGRLPLDDPNDHLGRVAARPGGARPE